MSPLSNDRHLILAHNFLHRHEQWEQGPLDYQDTEVSRSKESSTSKARTAVGLYAEKLWTKEKFVRLGETLDLET